MFVDENSYDSDSKYWQITDLLLIVNHDNITDCDSQFVDADKV